LATHTAVRRSFQGRGLVYAVFGLLVLLPVLAFVVAGVNSQGLSVAGPAGPALAFSAGVLSFVSPCVLPIVPIYLTHLSGASVRDGLVVADRRLTFGHAVAFVSGLSLVFIALGASVGLLGSYFLVDSQRDLERVAGMVLVLMGVLLIPAYGQRSPMRSAVLLLALTGVYFALAELADLRGDRSRLIQLGIVLLVVWLRFAGYLQIPFLSRTFELDVSSRRRVGYGRSVLVGGAFALGWTPCVGPILASILTLAATSADAWRGTYLLGFYALGLSIPFLIAGLALSDVQGALKRAGPYLRAVEVAAGVMLVAVGVLLVTGRLTSLNSIFNFSDFNQGL
jgi:cytochrome c-type biogenesis protein